MLRINLIALITMVLMCFASPAVAANGMLQERSLTFADSATSEVAFIVHHLEDNYVAQGGSITLKLDFATEGNANLSSITADPITGAEQFTLEYGATTVATFTAADAGSGFSQVVQVEITPGTERNVEIKAEKKAGFGHYNIVLKFLDTNGSYQFNGTWTLSMANLPTSIRTVMAIDFGAFQSITPNGAPGCPAGQTCQAPCSDGCTAPAFCHGPCPVGPFNICKIAPWRCGGIKWPPKAIPFPWPGPECLSCPAPWMERIPDGYDRVIVEFIALDKEGKLLGPDAAKQIRVNIEGGEAIGELLDQGDGQYAQAIQFRKGNPPRVSTTIMGATSEEIIADPLAQAQAEGGAGIYKTLTYVLSILLAIALAASFVLWRRAQAPQAATGG